MQLCYPENHYLPYLGDIWEDIKREAVWTICIVCKSSKKVQVDPHIILKEGTQATDYWYMSNSKNKTIRKQTTKYTASNAVSKGTIVKIVSLS